ETSVWPDRCTRTGHVSCPCLFHASRVVPDAARRPETQGCEMSSNGFLDLIRRGSIIAVAATTLITAGCGGGDGDSSSGSGDSSGSTAGPPPAAGANTAPTINGTPATQVNAGSAYTMTPAAADADGDTLAFS